MELNPPEQGTVPAGEVPAMPLRLEEPSLAGLDAQWLRLWQQRRLVLALLLALLVHTLLLSLSPHGGPAALAPASGKHAVSTLRVELQPSPPAAPAAAPSARRLLLARTSVDRLLQAQTEAARPRVPPPVATDIQTSPAPSAPASLVVSAAAPPAVLNWWQYAAPDFGYLSARDLDLQPEPLERDDFLDELGQQAPKVAGQVRVRIYINESGGVDRLEILEATPPGLFEAVTMQMLYPLRFSSAQKDGRPVKSFKEVVLDFEQAGERARPLPPVPTGNGVPR